MGSAQREGCLDDAVHKILAVGDLFDGKVVTAVTSNVARGLSGNRVGIVVEFTVGSEGIYLVTIVKLLSVLEMLSGVWAAVPGNNK